MSNITEQFSIYSGEIISVQQIAQHTFHLKIKSNDFGQIEYKPGYTAHFFLGNPYQEQCENRKYSFWHYDALNQTADFAICTFSNSIGAKWVQTLQAGNTIYFTKVGGKLFLDDAATNYVLVGDVTALAHLYEINRNIETSKPVVSFIYANDNNDLFSDIDTNNPLQTHLTNGLATQQIVDDISKILPQDLSNTIVYNLGNPELTVALHNHLKNHTNIPINNIKTKPFWK